MNLIPWRRKREDESAMEPSDGSLTRLRREMDTVVDRFFRDPWGWSDFASSSANLAGIPRTDLADSDDEVTVTMELPGVDPKDVKIDIAGECLTVQGKKNSERKEKHRNFRFVETQHGAFHRTVQLPRSIDPEKVDAKYKNGVLSITVAKRAELKPKKITVRNA